MEEIANINISDAVTNFEDFYIGYKISLYAWPLQMSFMLFYLTKIKAKSLTGVYN